MESFDETGETPKSRAELMTDLLNLRAEEKEIENLISTSGENVGNDIPLGGEEYKDFNHTERLNEVRGKIEILLQEITDIDDKDAAQRKLILE